MPTSSFLISPPEYLGMLESQRLSLDLKCFVEWVFHLAVVVEGASYSLHNAFKSTLLNFSGTAFKSNYFWRCLLT